MQVCKELCPVYKIQRCCFLCPEKEKCEQVCPEESNSLCEDLVDVPDDVEALAKPILQKLSVVKKQIDELETIEKALTESLKKMMEDGGVTSLNKNPFFKVTYIAAKSSMTFDTDLFKKSCPDVYSKYCTKPKETKAYIKCEKPKQKG